MKGIAFALLAALLFGASTPLAKKLLPQVEPVLMAGLLYLGSGIGLGAYWLWRSRDKDADSKEAPLSRLDAPWLAGAILAGGLIGPVLLMVGLSATPASSASLLLNLEGVLTALVALVPFQRKFRPPHRAGHGAHCDRRHRTCVEWPSCNRHSVGTACHRRGVPRMGR